MPSDPTCRKSVFFFYRLPGFCSAFYTVHHALHAHVCLNGLQKGLPGHLRIQAREGGRFLGQKTNWQSGGKVRGP